MTPTEAAEWFTNTRALVREVRYREVRYQLISDTSFLADNASMPQRLWHIMHPDSPLSTCKMCSKSVAWNKTLKQYNTYCGDIQCIHADSANLRVESSSDNKRAAVEKRRVTNQSRYGVDNYLTTPQVKERTREARAKDREDPAVVESHSTRLQQRVLTKYGVDNFSHTLISTESLTKLNDAEWLHAQHYENKRTLTDIAAELNVAGGATTIGQYLKKHGLTTQTLPARSTAERHIAEWLMSLGEEVVTGDRTLIRPLELDIVLPAHNIAIEYCGIFWHSEQSGKSRLYHKRKLDACTAVGIRLITIFSDEWEQSSDKVKSKLLSTIGRDTRPVVYARKCRVCEVSTQDRRAFLDKFHIQGDGSASVSMGLEYAGELVAVMGWMRQQGGEWLLNRYATSNRVVGGFSRLVAAFERQVNPATMISFADLRWSTGNVYLSNGWVVDSILPPDYAYSPDGHKRIHKFNYRRIQLPHLLDQFDPSKSEWENCRDNNVLRIWDCGKLRLVKCAAIQE